MLYLNICKKKKELSRFKPINLILTEKDKYYDCMKNFAFSLAEVLIVIAIIGFVAAITIPVLVNNIKNNEYVVALKKFYSMQLNGYSRILADEGVSNLTETSLFQKIKISSCNISSADTDDCKDFYNELKKYFKYEIITASNYQTYFLSGSKDTKYDNHIFLLFSDGTMIFNGWYYKTAQKAGNLNNVLKNGGKMYTYEGGFYFDINGFQKPNMWGRDLFYYKISDFGQVFPNGGKDNSLYMGSYPQSYWTNNLKYCGKPGSSNTANVQGKECVARIMSEGWEINY